MQSRGEKEETEASCGHQQQLGLELCYCNSWGQEGTFHPCMKSKYGNDLFPVEVVWLSVQKQREMLCSLQKLDTFATKTEPAFGSQTKRFC